MLLKSYLALFLVLLVTSCLVEGKGKGGKSKGKGKTKGKGKGITDTPTTAPASIQTSTATQDSGSDLVETDSGSVDGEKSESPPPPPPGADGPQPPGDGPGEQEGGTEGPGIGGPADGPPPLGRGYEAPSGDENWDGMPDDYSSTRDTLVQLASQDPDNCWAYAKNFSQIMYYLYTNNITINSTTLGFDFDVTYYGYEALMRAMKECPVKSQFWDTNFVYSCSCQSGKPRLSVIGCRDGDSWVAAGNRCSGFNSGEAEWNVCVKNDLGLLVLKKVSVTAKQVKGTSSVPAIPNSSDDDSDDTTTTSTATTTTTTTTTTQLPLAPLNNVNGNAVLPGLIDHGLNMWEQLLQQAQGYNQQLQQIGAKRRRKRSSSFSAADYTEVDVSSDSSCTADDTNSDASTTTICDSDQEFALLCSSSTYSACKCIVPDENEDYYVLEENERIAYDQYATMQCTRCSGYLCSTYEDVSIEVYATSA